MKFSNEKIIKNFKLILIVILLGVIILFIIYQFKENKKLSNRLSDYQASLLTLQNQYNELDKTETTNTEALHRLELASQSKESQLTDAVARVAPAVVSIVISKEVPKLGVSYVNPFGNDPMFKDFNIQVPVYQQQGTEKKDIGAGSGFLIASNGYIITNKHVVADESADYTVLLAKGTQKVATVVYKDPNNDMAILKIAGSGYPTVSIGDSDTLKLGQTVVAIGNALGEFSNSVSVGIVSGLNRDVTVGDQNSDATETLKHIIQTDAAINPGNSGGPLLDLNGNAIGINVATVIGSNSIGFSIPVNELKSIISKYTK